MIKLLNGNKAAANAVRLAKPDIMAIYPITPQTVVVEELERMRSSGQLTADIIQPEGENSSMAVAMAASVAGARVFTATSSWGLDFMNEAMIYCAGSRVPVVMVNVNRETPALRGVSSSRQDIMGIRDTGWVQIECETNQEILDFVLMAYRLAEDLDVLLPVVVSYDGYFLSHLSEAVDVPEQAEVDRFLEPVNKAQRVKLVPGSKLCFGPSLSELKYAEFRHKASMAMNRVRDGKFDQVEKEFTEVFGRHYGGMVETYRADDAEYVILAMGSCCGTAMVTVDKMREQGVKVGLIKIRMFRPYPFKRMAELLDGRKGVCVVDRSIAMGLDCGHIYAEAKAVMGNLKSKPVMRDFIDGISNLDITVPHFERAVNMTIAAAEGRDVPETTWLMWD